MAQSDSHAAGSELPKNGNGSELPVPNGSERSASTDHPRQRNFSGRRPILNDEDLLGLAHEMNSKRGCPPSLDDLIKASGGCQRQRASRAIRRVRSELAEGVVRSQLVLPAELELQLRTWVDNWISVAARQLADSHALLEERHEEGRRQTNDLLAEQSAALANVRKQLSEQRKVSSEHEKRARTLQQSLAHTTAERDIARALADDRQRTIELIGQAHQPALLQASSG